jgi:hypothetical protein
MNLILMIAELSGFKLAAHKAEQHKKQMAGGYTSCKSSGFMFYQLNLTADTRRQKLNPLSMNFTK